MAPSSRDGMVTRREAAERLGLHVNTIRMWEKKGLLSPQRVSGPHGTEVRLSLEEVTEVAHERRTSGAQEPSTRIAELEVEVRELRERLRAETEERERLLDRLLRIAEGRVVK